MEEAVLNLEVKIRELERDTAVIEADLDVILIREVEALEKVMGVPELVSISSFMEMVGIQLSNGKQRFRSVLPHPQRTALNRLSFSQLGTPSTAVNRCPHWLS
jgi:hypothetical protein